MIKEELVYGILVEVDTATKCNPADCTIARVRDVIRRQQFPEWRVEELPATGVLAVACVDAQGRQQYRDLADFIGKVIGVEGVLVVELGHFTRRTFDLELGCGSLCACLKLCVCLSLLEYLRQCEDYRQLETEAA